MKQNIMLEIICFLLIVLLVYAALSKLFDYPAFQEQIKFSPLLSGLYKFAWVLPFAELITAGLLVFDVARTAGLYASFTLLLGFTIYIGIMLLTVKHLPCSCGGVLKKMTWKQHLVFNLFFVLISIAGITIENKKRNHINPGC